MSKLLPKNIQLSEKLDFLGRRGFLFSIETESGMKREFQPHEKFMKDFSNKSYSKTNCRLIDFVNEIFEANELLYVMMQKQILIDENE